MTWIRELAKKEVAATPDAEEAVRRVIAGVRDVLTSNPEKLNELIEPIVRAACMSEVSIARHAQRQAAIAACDYSNPRGLSLVVAASTSLMLIAIGDKRLRDCTAEDLRRHGAKQRQQASGHIRMATFVERVAQRLGDTYTVKDVETEETLRDLMNNIRQTLSDAG